jgi:uncharacterized protein (DUF1800 family)
MFGCASSSPDARAQVQRAARVPAAPTITLPATAWTPEKQIRHVLNRLAYGPSPRDLASVRSIGVAAWIERQLAPASIDDAQVQAKLSALPTLEMSTSDLLESFPPLEVQAKRAGIDLASAKDDPEMRRALRAELPPEERPARAAEELAAARLIRAVESRRQLEEVLVDFWFNHFNVSAEKGAVRWMITSYERDAIRPHVFGTFRELLGATAHHPAMLFYLDNWLSTREGFAPRRPDGPFGLNENYARELMELHTLGVDGGYTQEDVREVARAFTGWSIERPRELGTFVFHRGAHDDGEKIVMGTRIPAAGGIEDGERVLDLLSAHPSTAHFIALKLCRKFVSDTPPDALVQRVARVFRETGGHLERVYAAIFESPEFWSEAAYEAKTKTPLELAASGIRALGGTTDGSLMLYRQIAKMGEPLYRAQPPTGFPEEGQRWVSAGALVNRINFGLALAQDRVKGTHVELTALGRESGASSAEADTEIDSIGRAILLAPPSDETRATIRKALLPDDGGISDGERRRVDPRVVAGLLLGSPEFQKQ